MSLTFSPMNNQATIPTTTANSYILVTLTSPSTITTTAIASASGMVSINPAPTVSVAATGQDFETRLNAMENAIFKLGSTLEKFISRNNPTGRSRGENDRGYLTDFSVNASQSKIDQSSDEESNCGPPPQKKPSSIISNDVFDKDINLLVPDAAKQDQSGKVSSAANGLAIFEEINKEKMSEEE